PPPCAPFALPDGTLLTLTTQQRALPAEALFALPPPGAPAAAGTPPPLSPSGRQPPHLLQQQQQQAPPLQTLPDALLAACMG
ncbi:hypothetical protein, partial [Streptococcus pneumoniae]|uniref:hypothetical protein n=1 Tax=Streptococcus pneumoniae TaxID=1313 RepID=UPI001E45F78B